MVSLPFQNQSEAQQTQQEKGNGLFRRISKSIRGNSRNSENKPDSSSPTSTEKWTTSSESVGKSAKNNPQYDAQHVSSSNSAPTTNHSTRPQQQTELPIAAAHSSNAGNGNPSTGGVSVPQQQQQPGLSRPRSGNLRQRLFGNGSSSRSQEYDGTEYFPRRVSNPDDSLVEPAPGAPNPHRKPEYPRAAAPVNEDELQDWQPKPRVKMSRSLSRSRRRHAANEEQEYSTRESTHVNPNMIAAGAIGGGSTIAAASANGPNNTEHDDDYVIGGSDRPNGNLTHSTSLARATSRVRRHLDRLQYNPTERSHDMEKRALILVADGSEEIETFSALDILTRARMYPVIASISPDFSPSTSLPYISMSRGGKIMADAQFAKITPEQRADFDAIVIPGGAKGAERLSQDPSVNALIADFYQQGKLVALSSAGAVLALSAGIAKGRKLTSNSNVSHYLESQYDYRPQERIVVDGNLITSRGPGSAVDWSLSMVEALGNSRLREKVESSL